MEVATTTPVDPQIVYPESDGKPMAETDVHIDALIYLREALRDHFRETPQVYVAGSLLLYYEEGNPSACVAPDVFVVTGVAKHERRTYRLWEEGTRQPWCLKSPRGGHGWKTWATSARCTPCSAFTNTICMIR